MKKLQENEVIMQVATMQPDILSECLGQVNAMLRAMHLWFHSAHNTIYGISFAGDHFSLYSKLYTEIQEEIDEFIEKSMALTNKQSMACPIKITGEAFQLLSQLPSPTGMQGCEISECSRDIVGAYIELLESACNTLDNSGLLTLGLEDLFGASANRHEGYYYLLNQRAIKER